MSDSRRSDSERIARLDRLIAEQREMAAERLEREGKCGCGIPKAQCAPERCSHPFARDAMWGNS